jgi:hypothetical protein
MIEFYFLFTCYHFDICLHVIILIFLGIILTARYFDKKRSRANALCLSGTAAGSFTLPMLIEYLFRYTFSLSINHYIYLLFYLSFNVQYFLSVNKCSVFLGTL